MIVYLLNIFLILIYGYYLLYRNSTQKKKKWFCIFASIQWIILSGLRGSSVGADTVGYIRMFDRIGTTSWEDILNAFIDVYVHGKTPMTSADNLLYKDTGYVVFQKVIHFFSNNSQVYLCIVAVIIFSSLAYFIYKNSEDPVFSYILFSTLFYSFFAITGIRQALATALILFIGFQFIKERKIWKFILIALIAYTLHKSVIVFIPFYFLATKKITWKYVGTLSGLTLFFFLIGSRFILSMGALLGYERESVYRADTTTYTLIMAMVGIAVILFFPRIQRKGQFKGMVLNGTLLAVALTFFTLIDQSMMRVQQYYALFLMFSIPDILSCFSKESRAILRGLCILILIFYLIRNNPYYIFFWQM